MAIPSQRPFPTGMRFQETKFGIVYGVTDPSRTRGGSTIIAEMADPYWECEITTAEVKARQLVEFRTWCDTLRGGQRTFLAYDQARPFGNGYATEAAILALTRAGGGAFDGTASITSFPDAYSITLGSGGASRLPAGFLVKTGDYIGIVKTGTPNRYSLHRVVEDFTADGSGVITAMSVEPFIYTSVFAAADKVNFIRPLGEFIIQQDSIQATSNPRFSRLSFTGRSKV